jgi:predicted nucleotidyltransferase component of viral defense system
MIPRRYITEWKENAPWLNDSQVEQDLVIERALVQLFSDSFIKDQLAFRGGTALHKIFLKPQARYSEDIDLVQIKKGPIKPLLQAIKKQLGFLGPKRNIKQNKSMNTITYRFDSEILPVISLRLKIEINCREHFTVFGYNEVKHRLENGWFSGTCMINSFTLEELLSTKLRALYQRKKGRDLFDLHHALTHLKVNTSQLLYAYQKYMAFSVNTPPSGKEFIKNLDLKMSDPDFVGDIYALIRQGIEYDEQAAYSLIKNELLSKI